MIFWAPQTHFDSFDNYTFLKIYFKVDLVNKTHYHLVFLDWFCFSESCSLGGKTVFSALRPEANLESFDSMALILLIYFF